MTTTRYVGVVTAGDGGGARFTDAVAGTAPAAALSAGSVRFRLARLARLTALATPGVLDADGGPGGRFVTVDHDQRLDGVTCIAVGESGYEVSLRLVCGLVPLRQAARSVRSRVTAAATRAGLPLMVVNVHVAGVRDPRFDADPAPAAAARPGAAG